jgi:hypothetical protein
MEILVERRHCGVQPKLPENKVSTALDARRRTDSRAGRMPAATSTSSAGHKGRIYKVIGGVKREFRGGSSLLGDTGAARRTRDTRLLSLNFYCPQRAARGWAACPAAPSSSGSCSCRSRPLTRSQGAGGTFACLVRHRFLIVRWQIPPCIYSTLGAGHDDGF